MPSKFKPKFLHVKKYQIGDPWGLNLKAYLGFDINGFHKGRYKHHFSHSMN